jgi:polyvinyl alcohol dehydrogenase (cytochrome)
VRRLRFAVAALALAAGACVVPAAAARAGACRASLPGGDWPSYGGPVLGQNSQPSEHRISTSTVAGLKPAWTSGASTFQSMPVAWGRCVYLTDAGRVLALDVRTGSLVWRTPIALPYTQYAPFAVAVADGRVHVSFDNKLKPEATALDAHTGEPLWTSKPVTFGYPAWQLSSPAVAGAIRLFTTTGPDFDPHARPGFAVLDSRTGKVLTARPTIPLSDFKKGYAGGGIWGTPVIDPVSLHAFAGTSNPYSRTREHSYDNAMIKIDVNPKRRTFGQVVAHHKGVQDNVVGSAAYDNPVCQQTGDAGSIGFGGSLSCLQQDVDFGNSPTLWRTKAGELMVSQLQKYGVMHTVRASDMRPVWTSGPIGVDSTLTLTGGNHGNAATDGTTLFTMTNPGLLEALDALTGSVRWVAPLTEPIASKNVVLANGVVFASDYSGVHAFDASSGLRLWDSVTTGVQLNCGAEGDMLALAHGTVLANCGGAITAFRL